MMTRPSPGPEQVESKPKRPRDYGFYAVILLGALAMGALADLAVGFFGAPLPPFIFTGFWGSGAILLLLAASTSKRRKRAQAERPERRAPPAHTP